MSSENKQEAEDQDGIEDGLSAGSVPFILAFILVPVAPLVLLVPLGYLPGMYEAVGDTLVYVVFCYLVVKSVKAFQGYAKEL